jgi:ATP synthase protein I
VTEEGNRRSLEDLGARIKQARGAPDGTKRGTVGSALAGPGLGLALRVSVELVASFIVAGGMGLLLDRWLGTGPWLLLVFLLLGAAAGIMSAYRTAQQVQRRAEKETGGGGQEGAP